MFAGILIHFSFSLLRPETEFFNIKRCNQTKMSIQRVEFPKRSTLHVHTYGVTPLRVRSELLPPVNSLDSTVRAASILLSTLGYVAIFFYHPSFSFLPFLFSHIRILRETQNSSAHPFFPCCEALRDEAQAFQLPWDSPRPTGSLSCSSSTLHSFFWS